MPELTFKGKLLKRVVKHSLSVKRKIPYEDEYTDDMGVWLVKDQGIYVMAPTHEERDKDEKGHTVVCYANGYRGDIDDDTLWDRTHAVSGDDFAEFIPLGEEMVERILEADNRANALKINLFESSILVEA